MLYQNQDDLTDVIYWIQDRAYAATDLVYQPDLEFGDLTSYDPIEIPRDFESKPIYVTSENGWILFDSKDGQLQVVIDALPFEDEAVFQTVLSLKVPDLNFSGADVEIWPELNLPQFDEDWFDKITNLAINQLTYADLLEDHPHALPEFPSYLFPVGVLDPGPFTIPQNYISYAQGKELLQSGQISSYEVDDNDQGVNRVVTLTDVNGSKYLFHARYDPETKQIFPPLEIS